VAENPDEPLTDSPGWGHPHRHDFQPVKRIGTDLVIYRCTCGAPGPPVIDPYQTITVKEP
jgi:hypothetical protein